MDGSVRAANMGNFRHRFAHLHLGKENFSSSRELNPDGVSFKEGSEKIPLLESDM